MDWSDIGEYDNIVLTTVDLKLPYDVVDVIVSFVPSSLSEMVVGRGVNTTGTEEVKQDLRKKAYAMGCNAVIGVRFTYSEVAKGWSVLASGTAVRCPGLNKKTVKKQAKPINPGAMLVQAGFPQYIGLFAKAQINAVKVPDLTESELIQAGIRDQAHRTEILNTIRVMILDQK
tara:strand:+ start:44 stop:562 length:519 start_codon:yes stop_codon:yes gene_type:complete